MKSEWVKKKLVEIADFNPKESISKGTKAKKIAMDKLQPFCRDISEYEITEFSGGTKFRNGDTIMARITPCLENGKTAKVNILDSGEVGFGSTEYIVFRAKPGISDPDFIYYLVSSPAVREPAIKSMVGSSGRQRVQTDVLQNLEIALPPYKEQINIATVLKALDDKIYLNSEINKILEKQAQSLYSQMFNFVSYECTPGTLSDIAEIIMGQSPKGSSYNEKGMGIVFFQGRTDFGSRFPVRRLFTTEPKRIAKENDILMSVRAPVGDLNVAREDCCIGRGLSAIRSKTGHQSYIFYTVFFLRPKLDVFNGEGTVFGSINKEALKSLPISIPPMKLIDEFETIIAPMDAAIRNNHEENLRLQELKDLLLPELMSRKLDISQKTSKL